MMLANRANPEGFARHASLSYPPLHIKSFDQSLYAAFIHSWYLLGGGKFNEHMVEFSLTIYTAAHSYEGASIQTLP
jgi:hypothetical protein